MYISILKYIYIYTYIYIYIYISVYTDRYRYKPFSQHTFSHLTSFFFNAESGMQCISKAACFGHLLRILTITSFGPVGCSLRSPFPFPFPFPLGCENPEELSFRGDVALPAVPPICFSGTSTE